MTETAMKNKQEKRVNFFKRELKKLQKCEHLIQPLTTLALDRVVEIHVLS